jgi:hypothetical protein
MGLATYAEKELRDAGLFDADSDYGGMIGEDVMSLVRVFAEQGHSGMSAQMVLSLFSKVAAYQPLMPLKNPMKTGEFHDVSTFSGTPVMTTLQSLRRSSVFSEDGGKTWYDIDKRVPRWKRWFGVRRHYIKFAE